MNHTALAQAERLHMKVFGKPAILVLQGTQTRQLAAQIEIRHGMRMQTDGGVVSRRVMTAMITAAGVPESEWIDSDGAVRARTFTYDGLTWQVEPTGVRLSDAEVFWHVTATQSTRV